MMKNNYKEMTLSEASEIISGGTPKRSNPDFWGGKIPWLSVKDFSNNDRYISKSEETITEEGLNNSSTKILQPGQIIISARGTVGAIAQIKIPMAFNQSCYGLNAKPAITTNDFLYYLLKYSVSNIKKMTHGAVFNTITKDTFDHIYVKIPPIPIQKHIAYILGTLDDKIELNQQMNQTLENMARAIFKSWFVDFDPVITKMEGRDYPLPAEIMDLFPNELAESELGFIPKGWKVGDLENVIKIHDSKRIPLSKKQREKIAGTYPYYGATKIMDYINDYIFDGCFILLGEDGSVITDDGSPILQYVWGKFWVNNHAHVLTGKNGFSTEYTYLLLQQIKISPFITGAVQLKLNQKNLFRISIVIPPSNIIHIFESIICTYFSFIRNNKTQSKKLAQIQNCLLQKLLY